MQPIVEMDLSGQGLQDLELLANKYLSKLKSLVTLNLSDNQISKIPKNIGECVPNVQFLNINNNRISPDKILSVIDSLSFIRGLEALMINLNQEEQVDYILKKMPRLLYLNGL